MEDPKALKFFQEVSTKTKEGRIQWEPTANESTFVSAVGGEFTLDISMSLERDSWGNEEEKVALALRDRERELLRVTEEVEGVKSFELRKLFEAAKRQALRVDEKLDRILTELTRL